ncbi:MAG: double-strand break repair protein AddB [Azospirillaceae bacterium]
MSLRGVFTIPAGAPFVDALAAGIVEHVAPGDPLALADVRVLLPTRRACRALREAFLRRTEGRPTVLPRMSPIGDIDPDALDIGLGDLPAVAAALDLPPAIAPTRRQILLARLIRARADREGEPLGADQAAWLAADLARLLDEVETEGLDFGRLEALVEDAGLARHWQDTVEFLQIVTKHWPALLDAEGAVDAARRRTLVLDAQAAAWRERPPATPVIAAGSTGSIPATRRLLSVVAALPAGSVVLPGLDTTLDDAGWRAIDEGHPQFGLKSLIGALGVAREDVGLWPVPEEAPPPPRRERLIAEALRPAQTTEAWRSVEGLTVDALRDLDIVVAATPQEEAEAIALMMREGLETPGHTAAVVTPDRDLARRIAAALERWGIAVDDSGGRPLGATAVGSYLRLAADLVRRRFAPVAVLALAKHPLAAGGQAPAAFRAAVRLLDRRVLRGPAPAPGIAGLRAAVAEAAARRHDALKEEERRALDALLDTLERCAGPFVALTEKGGEVAARDLMAAHVAFCEALAASDAEAGPSRLWRRDDGEAAAHLVNELDAALDDLGPIRPAAYPGLLEALMAGRVVRPRHGEHPRLAILGPLEARLQRFDRLFLAGLNEGTWPREAPADPWMSRPMRRDFGLPSPERRIGLSAHDFAQALAAPNVVLSRSRKVEGTPTVPSRWLLRLEAVLEAAGLALDEDKSPLERARRLDRPEAVRPIDPPAPRPPAEARPERLSVTEVGKLLSDPYSIYARRVLGLEKLDELEQAPGAADRGTVIHDVLAAFLVETGFDGDLPADALDRLLAMGDEAVRAFDAHPGLTTFWRPRFARIATWFVETERARRAKGIRPAAVEVAGRLPLGGVEIKGRADRIDRHPDGRLEIVDYKTGGVPTNAQVAAGFEPQLPLEALMVEAGAFDDLDPAPIAALAYWKLSGGRTAGSIQPVEPGRNQPLTMAEIVARTRDGAPKLLARFADPATPYRARPTPEFVPRFSDYAHLARIDEWAGGDEEGTP